MVKEISTLELKQYLTQACDMALAGAIEGETSYTNSFDLKVYEGGFAFIPRMPAAYVVDYDLYKKIFKIANISLYPLFTLLPQSGMYIIPLKGTLSSQRALFFPWRKGIAKRLELQNISQVAHHTLPLMQNFAISLDEVTHIAIAGSTGSGKTYFLTYLLNILKDQSNLTIIDPKIDTPARWGRNHNVKTIIPEVGGSKADYLAKINTILSEAENTILERQQKLYINPAKSFSHEFIVIDELLALTQSVPKQLKDSFFSLLTQIALLGRATRVHLVMCSQRFDNTALPVVVRDQANLLVQLGPINHKTTQFLFPDLDTTGMVIPTGKGTGLIQAIGTNNSSEIRPFLAPTYGGLSI